MEPNILPISSAYNSRDLGGYITLDGRKVKSHRLLRSGKISQLSEKDIQFLQKYNVCKVIDLRSVAEIDRNPDCKINGIEHFILPLADEHNVKNLGEFLPKYHEDQYAGFKIMCQRYRSYAINTHTQEIIRQILELLVNTKDEAILYHCSEGKDRTGIVTIIILYLLGLDLETIRQDYLFSNYLLDDYRFKRDQEFKNVGKNLKFRANMRILGSVSDAFFDTFFVLIKEKFGSFNNYLKDQLKVTPQLCDKLRELYLEKK